MKKRVIWKMFALTIVTLGIYRLYWFVKTRREMMNMNPEVKIMSPFFLFLPIILVVVSIGFFVITTIGEIARAPAYCRNNTSAYNSTDTYNSYQAGPPECQTKLPILATVLIYGSIFLFLPLLLIWLWGYSKGVETITGGHTSFAIALIVLLLVPDGIDILIIQDTFNKLAEVPPAANPSGPPAPVAA